MYDPFGFPSLYRFLPSSFPLSPLRQKQFGFFSGAANAIFVLGCGLLGLAASLPASVAEQYPIEQTLRPAIKRPLVFLSADGEAFARRGDCVAAPVTRKELPPHLVDAVLAMEDRRFYSHYGLDPLGILRAAKRNYQAGYTREGGSTITQQLVKISFLTSARTFERKMEEALLAFWLELRLTKDEILERYLNSAYFGEGCYGIRASARHFFGKRVGELSVGESALLVALLRSPTHLTNNFENAYQRARLVVQSMVSDGRLDKAELAAFEPPALIATRADEVGGDYADWLTETMQSELENPQSRQPLRVHTTFEPELQRIAQETVRSVLEKRGGKLKASQAALVAMRTDGRVVAMVGGADRAASQFNRAVQARRQPGSAFKTFVYLAALRADGSPGMKIRDEPVSIDGWEPENFGGNYRGYVTLTQAFASSINTVAVRLSEAVGRQDVIAAAQDLGIASPLAPNASISLGTSEVSLLEITSAYAAIAAGAYPVKPWGVAGLEAKPDGGGEPPLDSGVWELPEADDMRDLLSGVVRSGSGRAARLPIAAFGKTGTSQEHRDAWFIGFAGNLVVGVWVGNDDFSPMKRVTGGMLPAQIWKSFLQGAMKNDKKFERKLPRIAAFDARSREPADRPNIASLEDLLGQQTEITRYGHVAAQGRVRVERQFRPVERARPRQRLSNEFQRQLGEIGWPGQ